MSTYKPKKKKHRPPRINPEHQALFDELCEVFGKLGVEVRTEAGHFRGGLCIVEGENLLYLNKNHLIEQHIELLAEQLKTMELGNIYLSPRVREYLEEKSIIIEE